MTTSCILWLIFPDVSFSCPVCLYFVSRLVLGVNCNPPPSYNTTMQAMADATPEPFDCPDLRALNLPACPVAVWSVTFDLFHILDSTRALLDQNLCSNQKTNKIQYFKHLAPNRVMTENNHSGVWLLLASLTLQVCHLLASVGPELSSQTAVTQSSLTNLFLNFQRQILRLDDVSSSRLQ